MFRFYMSVHIHVICSWLALNIADQPQRHGVVLLCLFKIFRKHLTKILHRGTGKHITQQSISIFQDKHRTIFLIVINNTTENLCSYKFKKSFVSFLSLCLAIYSYCFSWFYWLVEGPPRKQLTQSSVPSRVTPKT